ncbi:MAG TPA: kynureninase [Terriglobales bacterium]|nr:kynureninase [Terriglobales bacterium]
MASSGFDTTRLEATREFAQKLDSKDPLARYRERFHIPHGTGGRDWVYLTGHSLGLQPKSARGYVERDLQLWQDLAVEGHFHGPQPWVPYIELLTEPTARLVGALPSEVVVMNTLTVNLHCMMVSFYRPTRERNKIVIESNAFPSDQYAVKSQLEFHGYDPASSLIELSPRTGETTIRTEDIESLIGREGDTIALFMLAGVNYYSGQFFDYSRITAAARAKGCVVGWDMAHGAGNVPLALHDSGCDFAVWCTYKYMNGGPGCVGGCFVHERHAREVNLPRFAGWWGHDKPTRFQMGPDFHPIPGAEGWQLGNPPVLAMAALRASLEIFDETGIATLREKSMALTAYLEFLIDQHRSRSFSIITPRDPGQRGAQLSLRLHGKRRAVCDALKERGVICDWREPDILRVAPVPLYNSFSDVYNFVEEFVPIVEA